MGSRGSFALLVVVVVATLARRGHAQTRCQSPRPHVVLELAGAWPDGERGAITAELRAALETQRIELCLVASERPVARVLLEQDGPDRVRVSIGDQVTDKRVERTLELSSFAPETRSLAIAIAADELLRASWAELLLVDAPPPAMEPPPEVREAVERSIPRALPEDDAWLELTVPLEGFGGGDVWWGGSLRAERWWVERVALRVGLGGRGSPTSDVELGQVRGRALVAELDVLVGLVGRPREGWHLGLGAGLWAAWASYRGDAADGVNEGRDSSAVVVPRGSFVGRYSFGPLRLGLELGAGGALIGAAATADGMRVRGSHGWLLHAGLSFGVRL
ncbi:MAG: hypothetical protein H6723_15520 [Sandaracinus sp.]|nr:hypothetical protein [Sandaracinus sp.]